MMRVDEWGRVSSEASAQVIAALRYPANGTGRVMRPTKFAAHAVVTGGFKMQHSFNLVATLMISASMTAASLLASTNAQSATHSSEANITVTGGPHAGAHVLKVADVGCELRKRPGRPKYFNDNFGLQNIKDPKKLSFVMVNIRNADGPGSPALADFDASVTFGPVMGSGSTYYMSGTNNTTGRIGGRGTLLLKDNGDTAEVTLDLQPQEGITVKGTVKCTIIKVPS